jgi:hypothetical protein
MAASGNPLIDQGTLNRLRASVTIPNNPQLNVTPPFLGPNAISMTLEGEVTRNLPTLAGTVTSPEPYQMVTVTIQLLRSQALAALYKTQQETLSTIGPITVRPDASTLPDYVFQNCSISDTGPMTFNGGDPGYVITIKGYYPLNSSLWNV